MASTVMILVFAGSLLLSYLNPFVTSYKLLYPPILDLGKVWAMEWVGFWVLMLNSVPRMLQSRLIK